MAFVRPASSNQGMSHQHGTLHVDATHAKQPDPVPSVAFSCTNRPLSVVRYGTMYSGELAAIKACMEQPQQRRSRGVGPPSRPQHVSLDRSPRKLVTQKIPQWSPNMLSPWITQLPSETLPQRFGSL